MKISEIIIHMIIVFLRYFDRLITLYGTIFFYSIKKIYDTTSLYLKSNLIFRIFILHAT